MLAGLQWCFYTRFNRGPIWRPCPGLDFHGLSNNRVSIQYWALSAEYWESYVKSCYWTCFFSLMGTVWKRPQLRFVMYYIMNLFVSAVLGEAGGGPLGPGPGSHSYAYLQTWNMKLKTIKLWKPGKFKVCNFKNIKTWDVQTFILSNFSIFRTFNFQQSEFSYFQTFKVWNLVEKRQRTNCSHLKFWNHS